MTSVRALLYFSPAARCLASRLSGSAQPRDSMCIAVSSVSLTAIPFCASSRSTPSLSSARSHGPSTVSTPASWKGSSQPGIVPRVSRTNFFSGFSRIAAHRASCSAESFSHWRSSTSSTSHLPPGAGRLSSGSSAEIAQTLFPASSARADAVLPKPQGALNKTARPFRIAASNRRASDVVRITHSSTGDFPFRSQVSPIS